MLQAEATSKRRTIETIVQLITGVSVLIGIYLVMVELRQSREISTAQMVYTRLISNIEHNSRIYGENLAPTLAKACHGPEELNDAEVIALYSYFQNRMDLVFFLIAGQLSARSREDSVL